MRFDVAVVGAGPAGSASAISLARRGYSVALIDKAFFPREKLCGDFLSPINWPLFEQLGVADDLLSVEHEEVGAFRLSFPRRRCYGDGFLLAGDAARVTEPVTGEGIYFALKSGILAGEAIDGAFRRRNGAVERFAGYGRLCRQAFGYRQRMNRIIRGLIYRPSLLAPLVRLSSRTLFPLCPLIDRLCRS